MIDELDYDGLGASLLQDHHVVVRSALTASQIEGMCKEAIASKAFAEPLSNDTYIFRSPRYLIPSRRIRFAGGGERLLDLHDSLTPYVSKIVGETLHPTRAGYVYYRAGDYLGVHVDEVMCEYTLLTHISGPPDPVRVYPSITNITATQLAEHVAAHGFSPESWLEADEPTDGFLLLNGAKLPHARPKVDADIVISGLCYSTL